MPATERELMRLSINFGALAPSLAEQMDARPKAIELHQRDADAVTRLLVRGLLSEKQGQSARRKILRRLAQFKLNEAKA